MYKFTLAVVIQLFTFLETVGHENWYRSALTCLHVYDSLHTWLYLYSKANHFPRRAISLSGRRQSRRMCITASPTPCLEDLRSEEEDRTCGCLRGRLLTTPTARGQICLLQVGPGCLVSPPDRNSTAALHEFTLQPQPGVARCGLE